jgi:3,4-dihydroxy-2-butanone 4-phosphate synthase
MGKEEVKEFWNHAGGIFCIVWSIHKFNRFQLDPLSEREEANVPQNFIVRKYFNGNWQIS